MKIVLALTQTKLILLLQTLVWMTPTMLELVIVGMGMSGECESTLISPARSLPGKLTYDGLDDNVWDGLDETPVQVDVGGNG